MTSYTEAIDIMYGILHGVVSTYTDLGYPPHVFYEGATLSPVDLDKQYAGADNKLWIRTSIREVLDSQSTLNTCAGGIGQHGYENIGLLVIQIFVPKMDVNLSVSGPDTTLLQARKLAEAIRKEYRKQSSCGKIWFTDQTIKETPPEDRWYTVNILVTYRYFEVA